MSLTLLYLSIFQDAQDQHGDNQIGIVQQLHKEGIIDYNFCIIIQIIDIILQ